MTKTHSAKKSSTGVPGARALITATSLAITIGGWAAFTRTSADTIALPEPAPAIAIALPPPSTDLRLAPQLLPTIVPAPPSPPDLAIDHPPVIPAVLLRDSAPAAARVAAPQPQAAAPAAQPAAPAPAPALPAAAPLPAVSAPPLRAVSAPPAPVARTRSSK